MRKPILFVNACVRKESRTIKLAGELLSKMDECKCQYMNVQKEVRR